MNDNHPPQSIPLEFTPEERAEFEAWEKLGDEAWAHILRWEAEEAAQGETPQPPVTA